MNGGFFFRHFNAFNLLKFFDTALHLFGFCSLRTETVDEQFKLFDLVTLVFICRCYLYQALGFFPQVFLIITGVKVDFLVPYLHGLVHGDIKKVAVVRDEDVRKRIIAQELFQPVAGFEIEMVGRLIEQQEVGALQQEFAKSDTHLPSATELFGAARPIFARKAESGENGAYLRIKRVAVMGAVQVFDVVVAVCYGGVLRRFMVQL